MSDRIPHTFSEGGVDHISFYDRHSGVVFTHEILPAADDLDMIGE
jgi:hypothetical protein